MTRPVTVVTGGSRGIGAAICARLGADGHDIVLGYRSDLAAAEGVAERLRDTGAHCVTVRVDTADAADVDRLFDAADELGPVTGLVNNAGVSGPVGPLADADPAGMRRAVEINVVGYRQVLAGVLHHLTGAFGGRRPPPRAAV